MPRGISLTYGQTTINGKFITTGRIQGAGGLYIDLDTGEQSGRFVFTAGSSGYNNLTDKPDLSGFTGDEVANQAIQDAYNAQLAADAAQSTANSASGSASAAQTAYNNLTAALKALAYEDVVELAKLGTTVIEGGMIKTTLLDAAYIRSNIINAGYIQTIDLNANRIVAGVLSSANGLNYFDLTNNTFKLGSGTNTLDWGVTAPNQLTVKGHIEASSGTIAGVTINANDQFSLNGSKVELFPNAGIRVFGAGYADFTNATLKVPTVAASGLASGEASLWIGSLSGITSVGGGGGVSLLSELLDVAVGAQTNGQALVWNSTTSKWSPGTISSGSADLSNYYTKAQSDGRFLGLSATAANATSWNAQNYTGTETGTVNSYLLGYSTSGDWRPMNSTGVKTWLGLGSAAYLTASMNAVANSVAQRDASGYLTAQYFYTGNAARITSGLTAITGKDATGAGFLYEFTAGAVQSFLGLGSAAYATTGTFYASGSTVANSAALNGVTYSGASPTNVGYILVYDNTAGAFRIASPSHINAFLGTNQDTLATVMNRARVMPSWMDVSAYGLFSSFANGAYFDVNTASSYGTWRTAGSRGAYSGIYDAYSGVTYGMFDGAGNGGTYGTTGTWHTYWGVTHACLAIGGSITEAGYKAYINGKLKVADNLYISGSTHSVGAIFSPSIIQTGNYFYSDYGMYNPANGLYFGQPIGAAGWYLKSNSTNCQLQFRAGSDTIRGYVYADTGNNIGFLHNGGGWSLQTWNGGVQIYGTAYVTGDLIAFYNSDKRLKDNIRPITNALEKVNACSGNYFEWNGLQDTYEVGKTDIGVIAQEIETVFPELVTTRDNDLKTKAVKYEKLTAVLLQAIKELSAKVAHLEGRVN